MKASKINFITQGIGVLDYSKINTLRLPNYHSSDIRIDKKYNYKKTTFDFYIDITNWYGAKTVSPPFYIFAYEANGNFQEMLGTSGQLSFDALALWLPQMKDKASANPSTWAFYTLNEYELADASRCISGAKDLVGLVTTNATVYAAGTPSFNAETQSLDYKVMAPHLTSKGEVFKGTYDLRIKSDIARCIYGFSKAPI